MPVVVISIVFDRMDIIIVHWFSIEPINVSFGKRYVVFYNQHAINRCMINGSDTFVGMVKKWKNTFVSSRAHEVRDVESANGTRALPRGTTVIIIRRALWRSSAARPAPCRAARSRRTCARTYALVVVPCAAPPDTVRRNWPASYHPCVCRVARQIVRSEINRRRAFLASDRFASVHAHRIIVSVRVFFLSAVKSYKPQKSGLLGSGYNITEW